MGCQHVGGRLHPNQSRGQTKSVPLWTMISEGVPVSYCFSQVLLAAVHTMRSARKDNMLDKSTLRPGSIADLLHLLALVNSFREPAGATSARSRITPARGSPPGLLNACSEIRPPGGTELGGGAF